MVVMPGTPTSATTALWDTSGSQIRANVLSAGIVGLFFQGIGTGMVLSQFATWLTLPRHTEHRFMTFLTVFITTVGLVQTVVYFLSTWRIYVEHNGELVHPTWTERVHIILTALISTPVQLLLLRRCYYILKKNVYFVIPFLLLLLGAVALAIFDTIWLFMRTYHWGRLSHLRPYWSLLLYSALSSVLDIILSSILFHCLSQSRKRVYADHAVQWISRLIVIVWQSAIPPTVCAIGIFITYIISHRVHPGQTQMWYPTLQAMIGKLYVLSHFYNINSRTLFVGEKEQSSTYMMSTLTVPALPGTSTSALNTPEEHELELYSDSFERIDEESETHYGSESLAKTTPVPLGGVTPSHDWL